MKHLLLSIAMLCGVFSYSQLTVKPTSSGTDSYVYAKDVQLYVEDYIKLDKNATPTATDTTEASIYLRGDAQLFQGNGVNEGDGMLSVYQTIDSTSVFHYTYWNSPVGFAETATVGNANTGILRFYDCDECGERSTSASQVQTTTGYNGASNTNPATVSTRWTYTKEPSPDTEVEANWKRINATNGANPFLGMIFKGVSPSSAPASTISYTFDMRGRPNNGDISTTMPSGMTRVLTGNPYPSTLDLQAFYNDPDNNEVFEILFWSEPKFSEYTHYYSGKTGGYGTFVANGSSAGTFVAATYTNYTASGIGSETGEKGDSESRRYSPIGQGFELRTVDGAGDGIITFKNSHRIYKEQNDTDVIFRTPGKNPNPVKPNGAGVGDPQPDPDPNPEPNEEYEGYSPQIRMTVNINDYVLRDMVLGFDPATTDGFDRGWDARSVLDANYGGDAYFPIQWITGTEKVPAVIEFVPFNQTKKVPITFALTKNSNTLKITTTEEINFNYNAYLLDEETHVAQKITDGKVASLSLPKGTYENRFYIVFKTGVSGLGGKNSNVYLTPEEESFEKTIAEVRSDFIINQDNRAQLLEVTNPEGYEIKNVNIFDMSGKLVISKNNVGNSTKLSFPTDNLADGVYLVMLTTEDDIQLDYKISVSNR